MPPVIAPRPIIVVSDPAEVDQRLADLGIPAEALREAVVRGMAVRAAATINDPRAATGIAAWGATVRGLREALIPAGWERYERDSMELVRNPQTGVVINVVTGDEATGDPAQNPRTRYPRGEATRGGIRRNVRQLSFFDLFDFLAAGAPTAVPSPSVDESSTQLMYFLLVRANEDEVQYELSCPAAIGADDHVDEWAIRLIGEAIPIDPIPGIDSDDENDDIDIAVTRRVG